MDGDCRAACTVSRPRRAASAETNSRAASRSATVPNVADNPPEIGSTASSLALWSVHAAGTRVLLPSGSTSSNSSRPWRQTRPRTVKQWPCNGWCDRTIVTVTAVTAVLRR